MNEEKNETQNNEIQDNQNSNFELDQEQLAEFRTNLIENYLNLFPVYFQVNFKIYNNAKLEEEFFLSNKQFEYNKDLFPELYKIFRSLETAKETIQLYLQDSKERFNKDTIIQIIFPMMKNQEYNEKREKERKEFLEEKIFTKVEGNENNYAILIEILAISDKEKKIELLKKELEFQLNVSYFKENLYMQYNLILLSTSFFDKEELRNFKIGGTPIKDLYKVNSNFTSASKAMFEYFELIDEPESIEQEQFNEQQNESNGN